jgi:hypothetical protein
VVSAACVIWWAFARGEEVAGVVFGIAPGQPIYEVDYLFKRVALVWMLGMALGAALIVGTLALGRSLGSRADPGRWPYVVVELAVASLVFITSVAAMRRPVVSSESGVALATCCVAMVLDTWRARVGARA